MEDEDVEGGGEVSTSKHGSIGGRELDPLEIFSWLHWSLSMARSGEEGSMGGHMGR